VAFGSFCGAVEQRAGDRLQRAIAFVERAAVADKAGALVL
jgi:hypothetical protein